MLTDALEVPAGQAGAALGGNNFRDLQSSFKEFQQLLGWI